MAIAMALILGPIMESNLRSALMLPENFVLMFFTRPISLILIISSIFNRYFKRYLGIQKRKKNQLTKSRNKNHGIIDQF